MIEPKRPMPLPQVLIPLSGESFVSFLERVAHSLDLPLLVLMQRIGLIDALRITNLANGYGVFLAEDRKINVAAALHLSVERLNGLLLEGFDGIVFAAPRLEDGTLDMARMRAGEWLYLSGSNVCPECIAEDDGAWQVAWKLPWVFSCPRHACLLLAECPSCRLRFSAWRRDRQLRPRFADLVPEPGRCTNSLGGGVRGKQTGMCGLDITSLFATSLERNSAILTAQAEIFRALRTRSAVLAGERVHSLEYFRVLRGAVALLMYAASSTDVLNTFQEVLPVGVRESVVAWHRNRDEVLKNYESAAEAGTRSGKRQRIPPLKQTSYAPADPNLLAGLTVAARHFLGGETLAEVAERIKPLLELGRVRVGGSSSFVARLGLPPFFAQVHAMNFPTRRDYIYHPLRPALSEASGAQYRVEPRHVPQLFWSHLYVERFEKYFAGLALREETIRVALSVLFAAIATGLTRDEAIAALGIERQLRGGVDRTILLLRESGRADEVFAGLHDLAEELSEDENLIDFAARREMLDDLVEIPSLDWAFLARRMGVNPGLQGGRSVWVAAMVWEFATGGDWRWAPAFRGSSAEQSTQRESFAQFKQRLNQVAIDALREYSQYLVNGGKRDAFASWASQDVLSEGSEVIRRADAFEPKHVPQFFWRDLYLRDFRQFFVSLNVSDRIGRATVSIALLELMYDMPRVQLGAFLGLGERMMLSGVSAAIQEVRAGPDSEAFRFAVEAAAKRLIAIRMKVDYQELRSRLVDFVAVPWNEWRMLAKTAKINAGHRGIRSGHAATWLWTELTQSDHRTAPAYSRLLESRRADFVYIIYAKFLKETLPRIHDPLLKWGEQYLARLK